MPWPSYTESFIRTNVAGQLVVYKVPPRTRSVLKCVTMTNTSAAAIGVFVRLHGGSVVAFPLQAGELRVWTDLTVVAYAGETMDVFIVSAGVNVTLSGFSFADPDEGGPPALELQEQLDAAHPAAGAGAAGVAG